MGGLLISNSASDTSQDVWDRVDLRVPCSYHKVNICCCEACALKALHNMKLRYPLECCQARVPPGNAWTGAYGNVNNCLLQCN